MYILRMFRVDIYLQIFTQNIYMYVHVERSRYYDEGYTKDRRDIQQTRILPREPLDKQIDRQIDRQID